MLTAAAAKMTVAMRPYQVGVTFFIKPPVKVATAMAAVTMRALKSVDTIQPRFLGAEDFALEGGRQFHGVCGSVRGDRRLLTVVSASVVGQGSRLSSHGGFCRSRSPGSLSSRVVATGRLARGRHTWEHLSVHALTRLATGDRVTSSM